MGETIQSLDSENMTRRGFLEFAGATVMGTALTVTGCSIPNPGRQEEKPIGVEQLREGEKLEEKFCNAVRAAAVTIFEYDDKLEKSIATATYLPD